MKSFNPLTKNPLKKYKKLNFGCGWDKREGYLNVDVWPETKPDLLIQDNDYSMIPIGHFNEILANDVLEHIPRPDTPSILLEWARYLKKGGKIHIQTSSILGVAKELEKNKSFADHHGWTICLFGSQAHFGDYHHVGFTKTTLQVHLWAAGFEIESFKLRDKWLFYVDARKVDDWAKVVDNYKGKTDEEFVDVAFRAAFNRPAEGDGAVHLQNMLKNQEMTRLDALKHLYKSPERLYYVAEQHGCL